MKKTALLAALCSVVSLSSCCRIVDCCFEDPCAPIKCSPCESKKRDGDGGCNSCNGYVPACKPCGGDVNHEGKQGPQARGVPADGRCRQQVALVKSLPTTDVVSKENTFPY